MASGAGTELMGTLVYFVPCLKTMTMLAITGALLKVCFSAPAACMVLLATPSSVASLARLWMGLDAALAFFRLDPEQHSHRTLVTSALAAMQQQLLDTAPAAAAAGPGTGGAISNGSYPTSIGSEIRPLPQCSPDEVRGVVSLPDAWPRASQVFQHTYHEDIAVLGVTDQVSAVACISILSYLLVLGGSLLGVWMVLLYEAASRRAFVAARQSMTAAAGEPVSKSSSVLSAKCGFEVSLSEEGVDGKAAELREKAGEFWGDAIMHYDNESDGGDWKDPLRANMGLTEFQSFVRESLQFDAQVADVLRVWHSFMLLLLILGAFLWLAPWGLLQSSI